MNTDVYRDAMARLDAGAAEEGRRLLEDALQKTPGDVTLMHGLALALDMLGERPRARELLEAAHALAPSEPGPACDLAMSLLERGEDALAEQVLEPVLAVHPDHPRANLYAAMALAKTDPTHARTLVSTVLGSPDPELRQEAQALDRLLAGHEPSV
ncbi:MAG: tetratricopeptide repeat protein [Cystobacter sp.]